jgi:uncharacterized hydrophobic protein (TIGR00271 family)
MNTSHGSSPPGEDVTSNTPPLRLNPTVVKGAAYAGAGLFVLVAPDLAVPSLRFLLAGILVVVAISSLWGHTLVRDSAHGRLRGILALAAAAGILAAPAEAQRTAELIIAAYLAATGALAVRRGLGQRRHGAPRADIGRGATLLAAAVVVVTLPNEMFSLAVIATAVVAVLIGLLMLRWGLASLNAGHEAAGRGFALEVLQLWLSGHDLGRERREAIADTLYFGGADRSRKIASYVTMLALSVTIATLAVLQDSTAAIIGAMLIAPLMTPIMGCAAGLVAGWRRRVVASLGVVTVSVASAIGLAWVLASWIPALVPLYANSQVHSRTSPTLLDMAIALAAGAAGAYATVDERVSQSLTGVAIAVALVPPLSVVGVALEAGQLQSAGGAFLLFATNLVSIILASTVVFVLVGFSPVKEIHKHRTTITDLMATVAVAAILIMVPLGLSGRGVIEASTRNDRAQRRVAEWLGPDSTLKLDRVTLRPGEAIVVVSGNGEVPEIAVLEQALGESLGGRISVTVEHFPSEVLTSAGQERDAAAADARQHEEAPSGATAGIQNGSPDGSEAPPEEPDNPTGEGASR